MHSTGAGWPLPRPIETMGKTADVQEDDDLASLSTDVEEFDFLLRNYELYVRLSIKYETSMQTQIDETYARLQQFVAENPEFKESLPSKGTIKA